jgi:hypothetical protein
LSNSFATGMRRRLFAVLSSDDAPCVNWRITEITPLSRSTFFHSRPAISPNRRPVLAAVRMRSSSVWRFA